MTILLLVTSGVIGAIALAVAALIIRSAAQERQRRRLALRRVFVLQAADRQMRAASNAAISALVDVVLDRQRPPGGGSRG